MNATALPLEAPMPDPRTLVHRWNDLPTDAPMALLTRKRIIGEQMMISQVALKKGCDVPSHNHVSEQFAVLVSGKMRFGLGAPGTPDHREITLNAGEVLHLPSNLPHSAYALEDCLILDLFSPPTQKTGIDRH
jgi:quercetin dioxygenase-like cupin family protein